MADSVTLITTYRKIKVCSKVLVHYFVLSVLSPSVVMLVFPPSLFYGPLVCSWDQSWLSSTNRTDSGTGKQIGAVNYMDIQDDVMEATITQYFPCKSLKLRWPTHAKERKDLYASYTKLF